MALDRDLLVKLLNLTSSKHDAEALNAIRHADALLRKHGTTWVDLLALPQESAKAPQPESTQAQQQQPTPRPDRSATFKTWPIREPDVRHAFSVSFTILLFPYAVFVWLYEMFVPSTRRRLKPVAMLVPIFGAAVASSIWVWLFLAVAQFMY
jgi:hypothetical protein